MKKLKWKLMGVICGAFVIFIYLTRTTLRTDGMFMSEKSLKSAERPSEFPERIDFKNQEDLFIYLEASGGDNTRDGKNRSYETISYYPKTWTSSIGNETTICLATHATLDRLHWIPQQAELWRGLISVSVYVRRHQAADALIALGNMKGCSKEVYENVRFTLVFSKKVPVEVRGSMAIVNDSMACKEYFTPVLDDEKINKDFVYPQNMMRNIARRGCPTSHILNVDVDMIARKGLADELDAFLRKTPLCPKCFYVAPIYEIAEGSTFPRDKRELRTFLRWSKARRYHIKVYPTNQEATNLTLWEDTPSFSRAETNIIYNITNYIEKWEPIGVLHESAPYYVEAFVGYGNTRSSHIFLLHTLNFTFNVLDNAFLSHYGFQTRKGYTPARKKQLQESEKLYQKFKKQILNIAFH